MSTHSTTDAAWSRYRQPAYIRDLPQEVRYQILNYSLYTSIGKAHGIIDGTWLSSMLGDPYFSKDALDEFRLEHMRNPGLQVLFKNVEDLARLASVVESCYGEDPVPVCLRNIILDLSACYSELRSPQSEHISHTLRTLLTVLPSLNRPIIRVHLRFLDYLATAAFEDFLYYRIYEKNALPSLESLEFEITAGQLNLAAEQHDHGPRKHHTHHWARITRFPDAHGRFIQDAVCETSSAKYQSRKRHYRVRLRKMHHPG
ncbi:hypothetical protein CLAFUW4_05877 [Fulvia fulva]|uniref:Uncharacterized protein n=1 Tax=Passalora fulva TaxID=5499 RepID=A0A9Q8P8U9_PASFU|nr:uncharacterized protein CLAFUR5_06021 [Fulvia fulva]KAK4624220.1 hypothetical protein CLAFUR4_05871 [Fulvia fulva]KAK4625880.1 hypothetical protein CLAFUR0_05884 [Fulvia fulva]UJO17281.1 hypothetical protein CLAFUR5_06021 [Fulvia fulva]WPV15480.1 hypothetical protein CLAFUW4_05877 [Fulvia fulva]WPV29707.1 hypothetical protein CLAFUW7_05875 [Fulvia fulva]